MLAVPDCPDGCSLAQSASQGKRDALGGRVYAITHRGAAQFAHAAQQGSVTSVGPDRYKVSVEREYLKTQYRTTAIIDGRRIIFAVSGDVCTIEEITRGH